LFAEILPGVDSDFCSAFKNAPPGVKNEAPLQGGTRDDIVPKPPVTVRANFEAMKAAVERKEFWVLASTFFVCGWTTNGLTAGRQLLFRRHTTMACQRLWLLACWLWSVFLTSVGTIHASGWLTDRFDAAWLLVVYYGLARFGPLQRAAGARPKCRAPDVVLYHFLWT
jgi:hypothetical protein